MMVGMPNPIEIVQAKASRCARCHDEALLHAHGEQRAFPVFQKRPPWPVRVMVVAEAPNFDDSFDEKKGRLTLDPKTDPSGAFRFELLASVGLGPEQVLFTNSVLCLPRENGEGKHPVSARQQTRCAPWLGEFIDAANPLVVVAFGGKALEALGRLERHGVTLHEGAGEIRRWRGRHLLALYHPGRLGRITRPDAAQKKDILVLRDFLAAAVAKEPAGEEVSHHLSDGARLVLRTTDGRVFRDLAVEIGFQQGWRPVFAFQLPLADGPPFWRDERVFIEGLVKRGDTMVISCRHEEGICEIEVSEITDVERAALREWTRSLPPGVCQAMTDAMRSMLDPRAL